MQENKEFCKWRDDFTWICFNGDSEMCADVANDDYCRKCELFMMVIILWFMSSLDWKNHKTSIIGFSFMQILYMMNMFCMWR